MKRYIFISIFALFLSTISVSQEWTTVDTDNIENTNSGDVKLSSSSRLIFEGTSTGPGIIYNAIENGGSGSTRYALMFDYTNNASYPFLTNRTPSGKVVIKTGRASGGGENTHFTIEGGDGTVDAYFESVNLGIGTTSPTYELDVVGNIGVSEYLRHNDDTNTYLRFAGDDVQMYAGGDQILRADEDSSPTLTFGTVWDTKFNTNALFIGGTQGSKNGLVGIGTTNPTHQLTVAGTINSQEIIVEEDAGADFVFESEYPLPTLEEVETFIQANKHLEGIPSAEEMIEEGVKIGELQMALLQKIEELTLYMIDLKKENDQLKERISTLEEIQN